MTDPIEAMAVAIEMADLAGAPVGFADRFEHDEVSDWNVWLATAAYNALRETLEPRAYHLDYAQTGDTSLSRFSGQVPKGWTETPLYSLPEIDNG